MRQIRWTKQVRMRQTGGARVRKLAATSIIVVVLATTTTTACSSDQPVALNQTNPPVTVTATVTVTESATTTGTPSGATTGGASGAGPAPASTTSAAPTPRLPSATASTTTSATTSVASPTTPAGGANGALAPADQADPLEAVRLVVGYTALVAQVVSIDALPLRGEQSGAALDALADRYRALRDGPLPTKVDQPSYEGRLFSLELFAAAAADEARADSPQAALRYGVIRAQTDTLLALVNSGLGTTFVLGSPEPQPIPPIPPTTSTGSTDTASSSSRPAPNP